MKQALGGERAREALAGGRYKERRREGGKGLKERERERERGGWRRGG